MAVASAGERRDYPAAWEADVVLRDGRTARIRPIRPDDAEDLRTFHSRLSDQTIYFRFFAPHPQLTDAEIDRFTRVDYRDRVAMIVLLRGDLVGVGRYERLSQTNAEVAFVIGDRFQGLGIGSLLLEHLAAAARETGISRFVADVLPGNARMLATFRFAGFQVSHSLSDGVVSLELDIADTATSALVRTGREQRHEAASLWPLIRPESIAVVGASRRPGSIGYTLLKNLITSGFPGRIFAVHPDAQQILGVTCHRRLADVGSALPTGIDLVIIAVPAEEVPDIIAQSADAGGRTVMVVSGGFEDPRSALSLARLARDSGMRLLGPAALGLVNTDPDALLNASLLPRMPAQGRIGFFCQSGALALDIVHRMDARGIGVSLFVSAGHRADVSGNDFLQFWEEDQRTDIILMYLETIGNPRKFMHLLGRVTRQTPVVVLRTTGEQIRHPLGVATPSTAVPMSGVNQMIVDTGVIEVDSIEQLLDVAEVLDLRQSLVGDRIGVVGNSEAVAILAQHAAEQHGLRCTEAMRILARGSTTHQFRRHLDDAIRDPGVDIVVVLYVPPVETQDDSDIRELIAQLTTTVSKPVIAVVLGWSATALRDVVRGRPGSALPVFTDAEHAMAALGRVVRYVRHVASNRSMDHSTGAVAGCDTISARAIVDRALQGSAAHSGAELDEHACALVLGAYGLGPSGPVALVEGGYCARVTAVRDPLLGPVVSFGVDHPIAEALGDRHYGLAPMTSEAARHLVDRSVWSSFEDEDLDARRQHRVIVAEAVQRLGALIADVPRLGEVDLRGVRVSPSGEVVIESTVMRSTVEAHPDSWHTRRLRGIEGTTEHEESQVGR